MGAVDKGRSGNHDINSSIRRIYSVLFPLHISPEIVYIESAANPADPYSRGVPGLPERRLPYQFKLPVELCSFFEYV